jgi:DNA-binding NarL/FixJ family response regulator
VAVRWLTEALGGFERRDPAGMMPLCGALMAMAKALVGDIDGARALLADDERIHHGAIRVFDPQARLAEACVAAAEGRSGQAGTLALGAAALAAEQGQSAVEALMLHAAVRFGRARDVVERLRDLAAWVDSPLVVDLAAHAEAAVRGESADLDRVSHAFEERGALLFAAEAAAEAAAGQERQGDLRAAAASTARAVALTRECGLTATPALDRLSPPTLTAREEEVAVLAARGLTNYAIAHRLVLSVRTVEAHLAHVYAKLGIGSRAELSTALECSVPTRPDGRGNGHAPRLRGERMRGR